MRIGIDVDDVLYPWIDTAHAICERAGITGGNAVTQWKFHRDYGCSEAEVWEVLGEATRSGELYDAPPFPGVIDQLHRLIMAEHTVHLVTARGFKGPLAHLIRGYTLHWVDRFAVPHHSLTFSEDKRVMAADAFIDDSLRNYDALEGDGVAVWLMDRPHNRTPGCTRSRVSCLADFVDLMVEGWS